MVTGASSGIGAAIAVCLAQAGADVVINYNRGEAGAIKTAEAVRALGRRALIFQANVADEVAVQAMFAKTISEFGRLDILVNNSGKQNDAMTDEMTLEQWNDVIAVNLTGQFLCSREAVRLFKKQGVNLVSLSRLVKSSASAVFTI